MTIPPFEVRGEQHDERAVRIIAKTIYKELRANGMREQDVMALAGELLSLVTSEVRGDGDDAPG